MVGNELMATMQGKNADKMNEHLIMFVLDVRFGKTILFGDNRFEKLTREKVRQLGCEAISGSCNLYAVYDPSCVKIVGEIPYYNGAPCLPPAAAAVAPVDLPPYEMRPLRPSSPPPSPPLFGYTGFEGCGTNDACFSVDGAITVAFRANPRGGYSVTGTPKGEQCSFVGREKMMWRTIFLDAQIDLGIVYWEVEISYGSGSESEFCMGISPLDFLNDYNNTKNLSNVRGACCLWFRKGENGKSQSGVYGAKNTILIDPVEDQALVAVEVDVNARSLLFFVNRIKIPHAISDIHVPFRLGMSARCLGDSSFTTRSLCRCSVPTSSSVVPKFWQCKPR